MKVTYAGHSDIGNKPENQDAFAAVALPGDAFLFAVFDGHGAEGKLVAEYLGQNVPDIFKSMEEFSSGDIKEALMKTFEKAQAELEKSKDMDIYLSGSTATVCVIHQNMLHVAHIGDSSAYLVQEGESGAGTSGICLTRNHVCEDPEEKARLVEAGARVEAMKYQGQYMGPLRLWKGSMPYPGQCVTRTFGDSVAHSVGCISVPEYSSYHLTAKDKKLVVASDGVWDGMKAEDVVKLLFSTEQDPNVQCKAIVEEALNGLDMEELDDNVTAVVVSFR